MKSPDSPWRNVSTADVRKAIANTGLQTLVTVLERVTEPPLPLEITLPKAIPLAGCALSQPVSDYDPTNSEERRFATGLARFTINTAGGQVCNCWSNIVAESGVGKDIGGVEDSLAFELGWHLGTSGSAEGLADALKRNGAGLLVISEFSPWLRERHWQHTASCFLTAAFNKGHFKVNLSERRGGTREARYCYPNIIANIQPEALREYANKLAVDSGFFPRFLISHVPENGKWRPTVHDIDLSPAAEALRRYSKLEGKLPVPEGYLQGLMDEFVKHEAPLRSHWQRLVNEYGPRLAVMLAVDVGNAVPQLPVITDEHWERVQTILRWHYSMAVDVLGKIEQDADTRRVNKHLDSMIAYVKRKKMVSKTDFSRQFSRSVPYRATRDDMINELVARNLIRIEQDGGKTTLIYRDDAPRDV